MREQVLLYPTLQEPVPVIIPQTGNGGLEADWFVPLEEPVRLKPGLRVELQQFFTQDLNQIPVPLDRWLFPLSEPVRIKPGLYGHLHPAFHAEMRSLGDPEAVALDKFLFPLSGPVRFQELARAHQQAFTTSPTSLMLQEDVLFDRYYYPLSTPVLRRVRPATALLSTREDNRSESD